MIGLDTNVIVRYLIQDEPSQTKGANSIFERAVAERQTLGISQVVLCEVVWVLEDCYEQNKKVIVNIIKQLLLTEQIRIEHDSVVRQALYDFENQSGVDFSDCLIGRQNAFNGFSFTYTFDKIAAKRLHTTFKLIQSS
ncbi:MAG: type II toxin-antitoxin system VapC family toxin [Candidatus Protochlamydia sp.]|nr:type II toxin-antitoxin system VapC family toxin [Candidatus Protochlamydia sp.]